MSTQVNLNIDELKGFLTHIVNNNRHLQATGKTPVAVQIEGDSGIGKTSAALQMANELGLNFVKLNLTQIEEIGDLVGIPLRQFQLCRSTSNQINPNPKTKPVKVPKVVSVPRMVEKTVTENQPVKRQVMVDGKLVLKEVMMPVQVKKLVEEMVEETVEETIEMPVEITHVSGEECIWVDERAVDEYLKRGYEFTGEKRMTYCPPEWIAGKQGGGILILDDFNRAEIRYLQAIMEICDRQEYISWKLPKDWHVILTSNPDNGEYLVNSLDDAQKTRFVRVNLKHDVDVWARWAENNGIDGRCINFLLMHPELITTKTNPRSITTFFNCISSLPDFEKSLPMIQMIGEGSVGPEFAGMFTNFINNRMDKIITPKEILLNSDEAYVMGELTKCIGTGASYRADIASVITTRMINWTLNYAENNSIQQKHVDRLIKLSTDPKIFSADLQYKLTRDLLHNNKKKFEKLMKDETVMQRAML